MKTGIITELNQSSVQFFKDNIKIKLENDNQASSTVDGAANYGGSSQGYTQNDTATENDRRPQNGANQANAPSDGQSSSSINNSGQNNTLSGKIINVLSTDEINAIRKDYVYVSTEAKIIEELRYHKEDEFPLSLENFKEMEEIAIADPIITFRVNPNQEGDVKHVNFGLRSSNGEGVISYGSFTSSKDNDPITGESKSIKISETKMDGAIVKELTVIVSEKKSVDFEAAYVRSSETAGQRVRIHGEQREYSKDEFKVSTLGMDYLEHNETAVKNVQQIVELIDQTTSPKNDE